MQRPSSGRRLASLSMLLLSAVPGFAQDSASPKSNVPAVGDRNVFVFGGAFHSSWFWNSFVPVAVPYENDYFLGVGVQQMLYRTDWSITLGAELGVGARLAGDGGQSSAEVWAAGVVRHDGFDLFNKFHVTPSWSLGLSFVTDPIGVEAERAKAAPKPVNMLIYMGPEIAVNPFDAPGTASFFRVQHRSGGLGLIMSFDGSNAATVGVRFKF